MRVSRNTRVTSREVNQHFQIWDHQVIDLKEPKPRNDRLHSSYKNTRRPHPRLHTLNPSLIDASCSPLPSSTKILEATAPTADCTLPSSHEHPRGFRSLIAHASRDKCKGPFGFLQAKNPDGWSALPPLCAGNPRRDKAIPEKVQRTARLQYLSTSVCTLYPPNLDRSRPVTADDSTPEWRINRDQCGYTVLVSLEKILLVVRDQAHSLRRSICLRLTARRPDPRLNERGRITLGSHDASGGIECRTISSIHLK